MRVAVILALTFSALAQDPASSDPKERAKAAKEAAKAGSSGIVNLKPLLRDPDTTVRIEAVKALVEIGSQYSLDPLREALGDEDPEIVIRATDGLVNFYLPGYIRTGLSGTIRRTGNAVIGKFRSETEDRYIDPSVEVRPEIITALGKVLSESRDSSVRANAARALGVLRGDAALEAMHESLRSKDTGVMYESLIALRKIRNPASGPAVRFLFRDPEPKIAATALEVAGLVQSKEAVPDIETAYQRASNDRVKRAALFALAALAQPSSRDTFLTAVENRDENLRAAALEGLGRLKGAADQPRLETALSGDGKMPPRLAAAFGLVLGGRQDMGEGTPLSYLVDTLNSKSWRGVSEAYLIELAREKKVRTALEFALPGARDNEKIGLVGVLAASGDQDSETAIERLTRGEDPDVGQAAIRALKNIRARIR